MRGNERYRLGVFGGSFNPIHNAHIAMAQSATDTCSLDRVLFLPTGNPPHKRVGLADKFDRLRMVELAVGDRPGWTVSDLEVNREGTTYTVDTLHILQQRWPGAELWYIIGADTLMELHTWKQPQEIFTMTRFAVCTRPGWQKEAEEECSKQLRKQGAVIQMLHTPGIDLSATMIRQMLEQGDPSAEAFVPPAVWKYLCDHRLYEATSTGERPPLGG